MLFIIFKLISAAVEGRLRALLRDGCRAGGQIAGGGQPDSAGVNDGQAFGSRAAPAITQTKKRIVAGGAAGTDTKGVAGALAAGPQG